MARIAGTDLPRNKRGLVSLTYIFGVGRTRASEILATLKIDENKKVEEWTDDEVAELNKYIGDNIKVEGELRSEVQLSIKRLQDIGCYRGCLLYTSPSPRDPIGSRMPSSA